MQLSKLSKVRRLERRTRTRAPCEQRADNGPRERRPIAARCSGTVEGGVRVMDVSIRSPSPAPFKRITRYSETVLSLTEKREEAHVRAVRSGARFSGHACMATKIELHAIDVRSRSTERTSAAPLTALDVAFLSSDPDVEAKRLDVPTGAAPSIPRGSFAPDPSRARTVENAAHDDVVGERPARRARRAIGLAYPAPTLARRRRVSRHADETGPAIVLGRTGITFRALPFRLTLGVTGRKDATDARSSTRLATAARRVMWLASDTADREVGDVVSVRCLDLIAHPRVRLRARLRRVVAERMTDSEDAGEPRRAVLRPCAGVAHRRLPRGHAHGNASRIDDIARFARRASALRTHPAGKARPDGLAFSGRRLA